MHLGRGRWGLEGEDHDFLAIPSGLAERLAMGLPFPKDGGDPQVAKALAVLRRRMTEERGMLRLTDAETIQDIERQLRYISTGR